MWESVSVSLFTCCTHIISPAVAVTQMLPAHGGMECGSSLLLCYSAIGLQSDPKKQINKHIKIRFNALTSQYCGHMTSLSICCI